MEKILMKIEKLYNHLPYRVQILGIAAVYGILQLLVPVLLFDYSSRLGVFWILLLLLYTALLVVSSGWLYYRHEIRYLEGMYGTDFVLNAFPGERKRRERKAAMAERKAAKKAKRAADLRDAGLL